MHREEVVRNKTTYGLLKIEELKVPKAGLEPAHPCGP